MIEKPVVHASIDRDPQDHGLWRWVVTVPSSLGEPFFERCGTALSEAQAGERVELAKAEFDSVWEALMRELAPKRG